MEEAPPAQSPPDPKEAPDAAAPEPAPAPAPAPAPGPAPAPATAPAEEPDERLVAEAELADRIAALEAREKELLERLARMQADFENFRRRSREDLAAASARGKTDFVKTLLPVLDNLDLALQHTEDEGLKLLARQFGTTLAGAGLVVIVPEGEAFDAKMHEAIGQESREGVKAGTVVTVAQKGYVLDGKVLRPARVIVAA